jgi:hypothetical protein
MSWYTTRTIDDSGIVDTSDLIFLFGSDTALFDGFPTTGLDGWAALRGRLDFGGRAVLTGF